MNKPYRVTLSIRADQNLTDIKYYLESEVSEELAATALAYITSRIRDLETFSFRFPVIDPKHNLRRMPINKFTCNVFYKIEGRTIKIYHVRHQAQNPVFHV